jgi:hypothetical protein
LPPFDVPGFVRKTSATVPAVSAGGYGVGGRGRGEVEWRRSRRDDCGRNVSAGDLLGLTGVKRDIAMILGCQDEPIEPIVAASS